MVNISEIDMDAGCDERGIVIINDDGVEEIAQYFAEMANKHNDNDWFAEAEQIAKDAVYTALSNPDLLEKLLKQYNEVR